MSAKPKNEARELAVEVLKFLDLKAEAERGRDSAGGLARVRQAEHRRSRSGGTHPFTAVIRPRPGADYRSRGIFTLGA